MSEPASSPTRGLHLIKLAAERRDVRAEGVCSFRFSRSRIMSPFHTLDTKRDGELTLQIPAEPLSKWSLLALIAL